MLNRLMVDEIVKNALLEDMNYGDLTTDILIPETAVARGVMTAKEAGVVAGLEVASAVFRLLDNDILFTAYVKDGERVEKGQAIAEIHGKTKVLLKGERTALNLLQRMSGIASQARLYADAVAGTAARVVDTRKTTPGLRMLEKYAVRMGGCYNHRFNLSDAVMIKDNHIKAVGSISKAIDRARQAIPHTVRIEVEVESLEQLREAVEAGADIVMLDNMNMNEMAEAVKFAKGKVILEASGNITLDRVKEIAGIGIDIISAGALTHTVKALDISMNISDNK